MLAEFLSENFRTQALTARAIYYRCEGRFASLDYIIQFVQCKAAPQRLLADTPQYRRRTHFLSPYLRLYLPYHEAIQ
jgi:hypothetical protein